MHRRDILTGLSGISGGILGYTVNTRQQPVQLSVDCDLDDDSTPVVQYGTTRHGGFNYGGT